MRAALPSFPMQLCNRVAVSDFQRLLEARQVARSILCDERDVLEAHPADSRVVKPWFHRDHVALLQYSGRIRPHARRLVDLQAQPVTRPVEEAFHAAVAPAGPVTFPLEELLDRQIGRASCRERRELSE